MNVVIIIKGPTVLLLLHLQKVGQTRNPWLFLFLRNLNCKITMNHLEISSVVLTMNLIQTNEKSHCPLTQMSDLRHPSSQIYWHFSFFLFFWGGGGVVGEVVQWKLLVLILEIKKGDADSPQVNKLMSDSRRKETFFFSTSKYMVLSWLGFIFLFLNFSNRTVKLETGQGQVKYIVGM